MRQFFITAIMLIWAVTSFGQHVIKGKVTDENGSALSGATVYIKTESVGKTTDKNGEFIIDGLTKARYTLEVSFMGYESTNVIAVTDTELTIKLKSKAFVLNEITVNSLRATEKSAVTYSDVKKTEIEKRNLGQDIPYLLALTPSFITTSDAGTGIGYTGFRIRGTDANRVNVTINGVPFNDSESHASYFVDMPDFASSLSSVQVQRGVGSSSNGAAAFGASINMQTENSNPNAYAELNSTVGSFHTFKNSVKAGTGLLKNKFTFDTRLSAVSTDGYLDRASANLKSYYFAAGYYGDKTTLRFLTFGGQEKTYQAWYGVIADSLSTNRTYNELGSYVDNTGKTKFYDNQVDNYSQTHYQLHWSQLLSNRLNITTTAHYTKGIGYYEEYKQDREYKEYGLIPDIVAGVALEETDLVRRKWLDNDFYGITSTLNYDAKKVKATFGLALNRYDGNHFGKVIWVRNAVNLQPDHEYYRSNSIKDEFNIFAKTTAEILTNLFTTIDLQFRRIDYRMQGRSDKFNSSIGEMDNITQRHIFPFFNPKIGVNYSFNKQNFVYSSVSIANREPNRSNYIDNSTSSEPKAEQLRDIELGYQFQSKTFSAGINLYHMKYKNQLILTGKLSEVGEALTSNIPDSYRAGIELTAGVEPTEWMNWEGNLTLSTNKIKNFIEQGIDVYDADWNWIATENNELGTTDIAYSPNVILNSILSFNYVGVNLGVHSNYVSRQFIDNSSDNVRSIPAYFINHMHINYSLALPKMKSIGFKLMINNILDVKYITNGWTWYTAKVGSERYNDLRFFPQAGRNFLASVTLKF